MATNFSTDVVMVGNNHDLIKDTRLHMQNYRNLNIRIEILDSENSVLDTVEGIVSEGSINVNGESAIRRTGTLGMTLVDKLKVSPNGLIWLSNKVRVYVGIRDNASLREDYTHYCVGTFYIDDTTMTYDSTSNKLTLKLTDYMYKWEDTQIQEQIKIEAGTPIHIAILNIMNLFGEFNTEVEMTNLDVPHDMDFNIGDTVLDIIQKIRDLYMDYDCYYTVDGKFVFKRLKIQLEGEEEIKWKFGKGEDLMVNMSKTSNFRNVKNSIMVVGKVDESGNTVNGTYSISDSTNPFHKDNIGERTKVVQDSSLFNITQCEAMAVYELYKSSNFGEQYNITSAPIYFLDANNVIGVYNSDKEDYEQVLVKSINFGLDVGATMTINGSKMYYNIYNLTGVPIEFYRAVADNVINMILEKGWLSVPEAKIYQKYGLQGHGGSNVRLRFQFQETGGVTAYVVGYETSKEQSVVLDLADFQYAEGNSGAQSGVGKGDYLDRVIGHEVLHLVMNDDFGVKKVSTIPEWYKEGLAELLHGADERLKLLIENDDGTSYDSTKVSSIVSNAYAIINETKKFESVTEDYASAYVILKIMAKVMKDRTISFSDFHNRIRLSSESGIDAFRQAVTYYFGSYDSLLKTISESGEDFVKSMKLDYGKDELDTGSINGSDYGGKDLDADNVFDHLEAEKDVLMKRFNVIIERP